MNSLRFSIKYKVLFGIFFMFGAGALCTDWIAMNRLQDQACRQMVVTCQGVRDILYGLGRNTTKTDIVDMVDFSAIEAILNLAKKPLTSYIFIMDTRGTLLSHPTMKGRNIINEKDPETGTPIVKPIIDAVVRAKAAKQVEEPEGFLRYHITESGQGGVFERMLHYRYLPQLDVVIAVVTDIGQLTAPLRLFRTIQVITMTGALLLCFLFVIYSVAPLTRSINELADAVEQIDRGNIDVVLPSSASHEISRISQSVHRMQKRLALYTSDLERQVRERTRSIESREREFRALAENSRDLIVRYSTECRFVYANPRFEESIVPLAHVIGKTIQEAFPKGEYQSVLDGVTNVLVTGEDTGIDIVVPNPGGQEQYHNLQLTPERDAEGTITGVLAIGRDITDRKLTEKATDEARRMFEAISITDGLTGIFNRRRFDEVMAQESARHARSGALLSLIMMDIDHFKAYNDSLGHLSGDHCLRQVAQAIAACTSRPSDLAARYGGEEFACVLPETGQEGAIILAEKIRRHLTALAIPHPASPVAECVTASFGLITAACFSGIKPQDIIRQADLALYRAKEGGRNRVESRIFDMEDGRNTAEEVSVLADLAWRDDFSSGNPVIDDQHRALLRIADGLLKAIFTKRPEKELLKMATRILEKVNEHFHTEESILKAVNFPGLERHAEIHAHLYGEGMRQLNALDKDGVILSGSSLAGLVSFLVHDVVHQHMVKEDVKFFSFTRTC